MLLQELGGQRFIYTAGHWLHCFKQALAQAKLSVGKMPCWGTSVHKLGPQQPCEGTDLP